MITKNTPTAGPIEFTEQKVELLKDARRPMSMPRTTKTFTLACSIPGCNGRYSQTIASGKRPDPTELMWGVSFRRNHWGGGEKHTCFVCDKHLPLGLRKFEPHKKSNPTRYKVLNAVGATHLLGHFENYDEGPGAYLLFAQKKNGVITYYAGCRTFTFKEAIEHWMKPTHYNPKRAYAMAKAVLAHEMKYGTAWK